MSDSLTRSFPKGTLRRTSGCQYCAVGCGYNAFLVPEGETVSDPADPGPTHAGVSAFVTPAMQNQVRFKGQVYNAAVTPDARCDLNRGNHSVRGASQGENLVNATGQGRSTAERLKSPMIRLADGSLREVTWSFLNKLMAALLVHTTDMQVDERDGKKAITVNKPDALGVKLYEYQYLENTYAATKLFYTGIGTRNLAYHDRPSAAGSSPGMSDAGMSPHDFAYEDIIEADVVLVLGANPYENQSVFFMQYMQGREMIVLDPRRSATAEYAVRTGGLHLAPANLGADSLILYALARELIEAHSITSDLPIGLPENTNARRASRAMTFDQFKTFLGVGDATNTTYTLANAARIAGVALEDLSEVARRLAVSNSGGKAKVAVLYEKGLIWGFNYHNTASVASLGVLLGSYGRSGRLTGRLGGHQKGWAESRASVDAFWDAASGYPYERTAPNWRRGDRYRDARLQDDILIKHNLDNHVFGPLESEHANQSNVAADEVRLQNNLVTLKDPDVHLLWIVGGNYLGQTNASGQKRELMLQRLRGGQADITRPTDIASSADFEAVLDVYKARIDAGGLVAVHQDIFLNPTSELCDIIIPAAGWGEDDFTRYNAQRRYKLYERFQDMPLHAADAESFAGQDPMDHIDNFAHSPKPDWRIFKGIALALGEQLADVGANADEDIQQLLQSSYGWEDAAQVADDMARNSNRASLLGDIVRFGEDRDDVADKTRIVHTVLGKDGDGNAPLLTGTVTAVYEKITDDGLFVRENSGSRIYGNGVASNGVILPVVYKNSGLESALRTVKSRQFNFVAAPWEDIEWAFKRANGLNDSLAPINPDSLVLTNGRVNHLWNNLFHHIRNEYVNERYPEDLPGTVLEINPQWAAAQSLVNGQVVEAQNVHGGDSSHFRAVVSIQSGVSSGRGFAMFSYPVRKGGKFNFDGFPNAVTDFYSDGINPIGALKYSRVTLTKVADPVSGNADWIFVSPNRRGLTYEARNEVGPTVPPAPLDRRWTPNERLDWEMRELIVRKGLPRTFVHSRGQRQHSMQTPDQLMEALKDGLADQFAAMLPAMQYFDREGDAPKILDYWDGADLALAERWVEAQKAMAQITELFIEPSIAIARLGSSPQPMENYSLESNQPDGYRDIVGADTLFVDPVSGAIARADTPAEVTFKDGQGRVKPVAPFFELWARFDDDEEARPLTREDLQSRGLSEDDIEWQVDVANLKIFRRTGQVGDRIDAQVEASALHGHQAVEMQGRALNFKTPQNFVPFGTLRYIRPSDDFPEIRLRFTPAAGSVFGPTVDQHISADRAIYDATRGNWDTHTDGFTPNVPEPRARIFTAPGGIFAQDPPGNNLGYFDDSCDGIIRVSIKGLDLPPAKARVTSGPPDYAPDSLPVRTVLDDLEQMELGPVVDDVTADEVIDIIRRALETQRLMHTEAENQAFPFWETSAQGSFTPAQANWAHAVSRHSEILRSLEGLKAAADSPERAAAHGTLQFISTQGILRSVDRSHDYSPENMRRMPALMRGADGGLLALSRRMQAKVERGLEVFTPGNQSGNSPAAALDRLTAAFASMAGLHAGVPLPGGGTLASIFADPVQLKDHLRNGTAEGSQAIANGLQGQPLVVPGDPAASAFIQLIQLSSHPMNGAMSAYQDSVTGDNGIIVIQNWISSL